MSGIFRRRAVVLLAAVLIMATASAAVGAAARVPTTSQRDYYSGDLVRVSFGRTTGCIWDSAYLQVVDGINRNSETGVTRGLFVGYASVYEYNLCAGTPVYDYSGYNGPLQLVSGEFAMLGKTAHVNVTLALGNTYYTVFAEPPVLVTFDVTLTAYGRPMRRTSTNSIVLPDGTRMTRIESLSLAAATISGTITGGPVNLTDLSTGDTGESSSAIGRVLTGTRILVKP